jgi:Co/Zn/Cd efflux system component
VKRQIGVLWTVLFINVAMFGVELVAGLLAGSIALLSDSADMLGDAWVYGLSLFAIGRGPLWKVRAASAKALVMALFGAFVLGQLIHRVLHPGIPDSATMGWIGLLALAANSLCFGLLWRHRAADINMRSVWLCSRNDLIANGSVLAAALAVRWTGSAWPDWIVGGLICAVFLQSAWVVGRASRAEWLRLHRTEALRSEDVPGWTGTR